MAISLSDNDPRVRYTATSGQTVFAVPFEFFDNDDFDVFEEDTSGSVTQKTLTTHLLHKMLQLVAPAFDAQKTKMCWSKMLQLVCPCGRPKIKKPLKTKV